MDPRPSFLASTAIDAHADHPNTLKVAAFSCDISPPVGSPMAGGLLKSVERVESALEANGIVLSDGEKTDIFIIARHLLNSANSKLN